MSIDELKLLTETEAATLLGCKRSKMRRLRRDGHLPFIPGRPVLIPKQDLEAYIRKEEQTAIMKATQPHWAWGRNLTPEQIQREAARRWAIEIVCKPKRAPRRPKV